MRIVADAAAMPAHAESGDHVRLSATSNVMELFIYEHCPFCCRALMIVGLKQLDVDIGIIMEGDVETPTRMVGRKVVPILRRPDGSHMPESMDIVHYLDQSAAPALVQRGGDDAIDAWVERAWPLMLRLCVPRFTRADFRELATPAARKAFVARETRAFGDLQALLDDSDTLLAALRPLLDELEPLLATRGEATDESDFRLFPLLRSLTIVKGIGFGANGRRYLDAISARCRVALFDDKAA